MGYLTKVYKINDDLAINIPSQVLPPSRVQIVEERVEVPGEPAETVNTYPLIVRAYPIGAKIPRSIRLLIPKEQMLRLGLDSYEKMWIRIPGRDEWYPAHFYHGYYGRVTIPINVARQLNIAQYHGQLYDVYIMGKTFPRTIIRHVRRSVRNVVINHMGNNYQAENYAPNRYRWVIPNTIESFPVLQTAMNMYIAPEAQCHLSDLKDVIFVDFVFNRVSAVVVAENTGFAFRNMAVRNYTATVDVDYPFLCEIRATYLSCTPLSFYQPDRFHHTRIKEALQITVYNLLQHFFSRLTNRETGEELPWSTMSYADHIDSIDYTTNAVNLKRTYPSIPVKQKWEKNYMDYTSEGEAISDEEFGIQEKKYYYCIKYIRVLNESSYQSQQLDRWVYLNNTIENMINERQRNKMIAGRPAEVEIDQNGFIWKK